MHVWPLIVLAVLFSTADSAAAAQRPTPHTHVLRIRRQPFCANAPNSIAGTTHPPRKSTNTILWCAASSRTYIILEMVSLLPTHAVVTLLDEAINSVLGHVDVFGDGLIPGGLFSWDANGLGLETWDSNNHQQTWGVLGAALEALEDYMKGAGYGRVLFTIMDGQNEVGQGTLG